MTLKSNLQEIYYAAQAHGNTALPLVANYSGTHIYDATRGWGRLWLWIYNVTAWFTTHDLRLEKLKQAILHTHKLFHTQLTNTLPHISAYQTYLKQAGNGYEPKEYDYHNARKQITIWNSSTRPFLHLIKKHSHPYLNNLLHFCFEDKFTSPTKLFTTPSQLRLRQYLKIIDLEGISQGPLPLYIFKKIMRKKPLNSFENKELDRWIKKINGLKIPVHILHKGLSSLCLQYKKPSETHSPEKLELSLEERGCTILQCDDPKHLKWRQKAKKDTSFQIDQKQLTLKSELFPTSNKATQDVTHAYAVDNDAYIALIAQNRAALGLRNLKHTSANTCGIECASFIGITKDERIGLLERLKPIDSKQWTSTESKINPQDTPLITALSDLLKAMVQQNLTISPLSLDTLMIDKNGRLKSTKPLKELPFDFNAIDDFLRACSGNNTTIFEHLLKLSGLPTHPTALFYRDIVSNAVLGETIAADDLAGIHKIADPQVVDRGTILAKQIATLHAQLHMKLRKDYPQTDPQSLQKKIGETILTCYDCSKSYGTLPTSFPETVQFNLENAKT